MNSDTGEVKTISKLLGDGSTSSSADANEAEFLAVIIALDELIELKCYRSNIKINTDSKVIADMFWNRASIDDKSLKRLGSKILKKARKFIDLNIKWIPRKENRTADKLCCEAFKEILPAKKKKKKKKSMTEKLKEITIMHLHDSLYLARSSKRDKYYKVDLNYYTCTCKFFTYQKKSILPVKCKHIIKAEMLKNEIKN